MEANEIQQLITNLEAGKVYFFKESIGPEHRRREYRALEAGRYEVQSSYVNARTGDQEKKKREYTREELERELSLMQNLEEKEV